MNGEMSIIEVSDEILRDLRNVVEISTKKVAMAGNVCWFVLK